VVRSSAASDVYKRQAKLYENLLQASAGHSLCRVWNYVPAINAPGPGAEENYRLFCLARSEAIESAYGSDFPQKLPAASAVGTDSDQLSVLFAAHKNVPRHFENPAQVPAYDYPPEHGPRSPSFARATVLTNHSSKTTFISGTAAIKGHASCFPNNTHAQLHCTLDNLRIISDTCGLGPDLAASSAKERHFKVYLRNAQDLDSVAAALSETLLLPTDQVIYLRSDICRAELTIEIEATILESLPG
jgi:chorismate lyase/3-hydroxybenzoate synthase